MNKKELIKSILAFKSNKMTSEVLETMTKEMLEQMFNFQKELDENIQLDLPTIKEVNYEGTDSNISAYTHKSENIAVFVVNFGSDMESKTNDGKKVYLAKLTSKLGNKVKKALSLDGNIGSLYVNRKL